ncbi:helix-turn-helix domain-containing protein [Streptomyces sp. AK02-01A]|uniref:helix-turn-helix domain-containing protein n=1 Tax=Streptomyces sp. AK02-01A TaxID=3028648 RepID=UPI0029A16A6C|nr:helix-turn-helix domain-containing protein [Streptomyces sp. AK02-01A]MDX3850196.1 helix-turn-helix domain-containing protein [Streptomyces sp. AK02-01A]
MLEVLGLDHWAEVAYFALVDGSPLSVGDLESRTGIEHDALKGALVRLEDRGLISRMAGRPVRYAALPPENAVEVLLLARERDIQRVRALAQRLADRHRKARAGRDSTPLIEVITGPDGVARCGQQLFRRAEHEIRGIDAPPYAQTIDGSMVNSSTAIEDRRVRSRFIHARDAFSRPDATLRIERDIAAGEEVRFLPEAPMKMVLADDQAGLIPLLATPRVLDSCILVHPSALLDALSALFETLWQHAQPFRPGGPADDEAGEFASEEERRIVSLLATGLPDEAIARQLGVGHRTVQRRVQALLVRLGASSRFQAGVLAASRGWWLPGGPE